MGFETSLLQAVRRPMWRLVQAVAADPGALPDAARELTAVADRIAAELDERRRAGLDDAVLAGSVAALSAVAAECARHHLGATSAGRLADAYRGFCHALDARLAGTEPHGRRS